MVKLSSNITVVIIGAVLLVAFIAFLALPKDVPDARKLKTERLVKLVNVPQIEFASAEPDNNLTMDVLVCPPDGRIVSPEIGCELEIINNCEAAINETITLDIINETQPVSEIVNCDSTITSPVCGFNDETYINSCFAEAAGTSYKNGMCTGTGDGITAHVDLTKFTLDDTIKSGISLKCSVVVSFLEASRSQPELFIGDLLTEIKPYQTPSLSSGISQLDIHAKNYRFSGLYFDRISNQFLHLDLVQKDKTLYFRDPESERWLGVDATVKVTEIPGVSQSLGLTESTTIACEQLDLETYLLNKCPVLDQCLNAPELSEACRQEALDEYLAEACEGEDFEACKSTVLETQKILLCQSETIREGSMICEKVADKNLVKPPATFTKTTVADMVKLVQQSSKPKTMPPS